MAKNDKNIGSGSLKAGFLGRNIYDVLGFGSFRQTSALCFSQLWVEFHTVSASKRNAPTSKLKLGTTSLLIDGDGGQNLKHTFVRRAYY